MRYAMSTYDAPKIAQQLSGYMQKHSPDNWWAIVDRGFDYEENKILELEGLTYFFAYQNDLLDLHKVSPVVISLSSSNATRHAQLLYLLSHCNAKPMLSFISTPFPQWGLEKKVKNWQQFTTEGDEQYFLRFADTRTLEALELYLLEDNYRYFSYGLTEWITLGRSGKLTHYLFDRYPRDDTQSYDYLDRLYAQKKLELLEQEFYKILDYSEADRIFQHLLDRHSDYFKQRLPEDLLQDIRSALGYLENLEIQDNLVAVFLVFLLHKDKYRNILEQEDFTQALLASNDRRQFIEAFYNQQ